MKNSTIEFREVTLQNWVECVALRVHDAQADYVSSNLYSLAQSKFELNRQPFAIYSTEQVMVGFVMFNTVPFDDGGYRISRLMIDQTHQGNGYGAAAAKKAVTLLSEIRECHEIKLDCHPDNLSAATLWGSLGFRECGNLGKNIEWSLKLDKSH